MIIIGIACELNYLFKLFFENFAPEINRFIYRSIFFSRKKRIFLGKITKIFILRLLIIGTRIILERGLVEAPSDSNESPRFDNVWWINFSARWR